MPLAVIATVNEKTTSFLTASFFDENGVATIPSAVYFSIRCATEDSSVRVRALLSSPAAVMEIQITALENAIHDTTNAYEIHEATFEVTYAGSKQLTEITKWRVKNLKSIT